MKLTKRKTLSTSRDSGRGIEMTHIDKLYQMLSDAGYKPERTIFIDQKIRCWSKRSTVSAEDIYPNGELNVCVRRSSTDIENHGPMTAEEAFGLFAKNLE